MLTQRELFDRSDELSCICNLNGSTIRLSRKITVKGPRGIPVTYTQFFFHRLHAHVLRIRNTRQTTTHRAIPDLEKCMKMLSQ